VLPMTTATRGFVDESAFPLSSIFIYL